MHHIARGTATVNSLYVYYSWNEKAWPADAMRMLFVTNHDKNAWDGTEYEHFGPALKATIVLSFISEGMPLIYNGQEAGNPRRLAFFEKDPIEWREHPMGTFYQRLIALKKQHRPLWNAHWGTRMINVPNSTPTQVLSFVRQDEQDKVFAVFNFSDQAQAVQFDERLYHGAYRDAFSGEAVEFPQAGPAALKPWLKPWEYKVYVKK